MKTPWEYAETGNEFSDQVALFQWCNVAAKFGLRAAADPLSYTKRGHALTVMAQGKADAVYELSWLYAVKNAGHGDAIRGARSAAEGVKPGVPDLCLPVSRPKASAFAGPSNCRFHGLYIELKRGKQAGRKDGVVGPEQIKWCEFLKANGYAVAVCYGWEAARDVLLQYLNGGFGG